MLESYILSLIEKIEDIKLKEKVAKVILKESGRNQSEKSQKENIVIKILICDLLIKYKLEDLNWKNLCLLQNIEINKELDKRKNMYPENLINIVNSMIKSYEKMVNWDGFNFYRVSILSIYSEVYIDNIDGIKCFLKCNKRINLRDIREFGKESILVSEIQNDFPYKSMMNQMIAVKYSRHDKKYGTGYININCNTTNKFLKKLYLKFYEFYNLDGSNNRGLRIFYYFFSKIVEYDKINNYIDLNFYILKKSYKEIKSIVQNEKIKKSLEIKLIALYRFLINLSDNSNINLGLNDMEKEAIMSDSVCKILNEEYTIYHYNPNENIPIEDKICIVPNEYTISNSNNSNYKLIFINFTDVSKSFYSIFKLYVWSNYGNIREKKKNINFLKKFFSFIDQYSNENKQNINLESIYLFRKILEDKYKNNMTLKGYLKSLRSFLNFYRKYNYIDEKIFDVLTLKGLEKSCGGNIITNNDLKSIYKEFLRLEKENRYGRLYTLVFEIFIYSNFRLGEITNLNIDCIYEENYKSYIKYFPKVGGKELVRIIIDEKIKRALKEAISFSNKYRKDDLLSKYIFIEEYSRKSGGIKRIDFPKYLKNIIKNIEGNLEKKYYISTNIRHTYMNKVCEEANKKNLSFLEIEAITNDCLKTIRKYYQQRDRIELMAGVTISDVNINGEILNSEEEIEEKKIVKNRLGRCKEKECNFDIAECLICNNFVTFINRKNVFLNEINKCNVEIENTKNEFIRKEKIYEKKLLAKYLAEIIKIEEGKFSV